MIGKIARRRFAAFAGGAIALGPLVASAQPYPAKPIRLIIGFAPGGGSDITARILTRRMTELLGQSFVIDNKPGAGGNIAAELVSKAAPDGYTLHLAGVGPLVVSPHIGAKMGYDPLKDLAPVGLAVHFNNVLVVHPSVPARTVHDYIGEAKKRSGGMDYGTSGIASAGHLSGELFRFLTGAPLVHIAYKGGGPAMSDLVAGQIPSMFATLPSAAEQIKSGKIRALAVTGRKRSASFPELPTIAELGWPEYEAVNWYSLVFPVGVSPGAIERINAALKTTLADPEIVAALAQQGIEPFYSTPDEHAAYLRRESAQWASVVKRAGIRAE